MPPSTPRLIESETTRRQLLALATVGGAGVLGVATATPSSCRDAAKIQLLPDEL